MKPLLFLLPVAVASAQTWVAQNSGTNASLRGASALSPKHVWASGTGGAYLHSTDGGATWSAQKVPGAEDLDFRDIQAVGAQTVYLLSIGPGAKSRIYKTTDGGARWNLRFTNPDAKGFFDALAFWDARRGIILGDPVDGRFAIFTTSDGGEHWERRTTPAAVPGEGAFAASGTCLITAGRQDAWFVTGGAGGARVFHSADSGRSWTVATTPIRNDAPAAGIFSIAFSDAKHGVIVGGDYTKSEAADHSVAVTSDGGRTWTEPAGAHPKGFRSAVAFLPSRKMWLAVGTSGSDVSYDNGANWKAFDSGAYNAIAVAPGGEAWAVGPQGRVAVLRLP
jgi:photosystem II stability/assembly factor-like uncharacterized protein